MAFDKRTAMAAVVTAALTACGGGSSGARIGPEGGTVTTPTGVRLVIPAGALTGMTEIQVSEAPRHEGEPRHIEIEPHGLPLAVPGTLSVRSDDGNAADEKMVEIEHGPEMEIEHGLETEHHNEVEHGREAEIEHLGEFEVRDARVCDPACDAGLECDDGVCKPHGTV